MKSLLLIIALLSLNISIAQTPSKEVDPRIEIWNTHVKAIIDLHEKKIIELTHFPLEGDWYIDEGQTPDELKSIYSTSLEFIYTEEMRRGLKKKDYSTLMVHPYKNSVAYVFTYVDKEWDSSTMVDIADVDGEWKIVAVTIK